MDGHKVVIDEPPDEMLREVAALAAVARRANGPAFRALVALGSKAEAWMAGLPLPARQAIDQAARQLLSRLYQGAGRARANLPSAGPWGHGLTAAASGAAGGAMGLGTALVEMPAAVMVMFSAMQAAAEEAGFDPSSGEVRLICLDIFGSGAPGPGDDGVNSTFLGARLALNTASLQAVLSRILPAFSLMLGKTVASKALPVLGAVAGAGVNYAFTTYYQDVARVRFGVLKLERKFGREAVHHAFRAEFARKLPG